MPLLDIATAQASLQNHLGLLRGQSLVHCKVFSSPFTICDEKILGYDRRSFRFPEKVNPQKRSKLQIKAVATLEPKHLVHREDGKKSRKNEFDVNSETAVVEADGSNADWTDLDERERLRRMRISKANKGNTPWNKGRKHSAETLQRIRERTRLAMQNPKIKMKLANLGHAQSEETREKIGVGVRMRWQKRREKQMAQETCYFEWQNLIAEASRAGYAGEEELQWDSYKIMKEKLAHEWVERIEERKTRPKGNKRAPKPLEQRRKIAEAIAAKWADPEYRNRVCSGLVKYYGTPAGAERKRRRRPSGDSQSPKRDPVKRNTSNIKKSSGNDARTLGDSVRLRTIKKPSYKDPLASSKLEMLKNIRAQRAAAETKKAETIERARSLVSEAEKAAKVLEVAAMKSPLAQASLIEARKLIAEAIQYLEAIDAGYPISNENESGPSGGPAELVRQVKKEINTDREDTNQAEWGEVNGTKILASSKDKYLGFTNLSIHNVVDGEKEVLPMSSNGYYLSPFKLEHLMMQSSSAKLPTQTEANGKFESEKNTLPNGSKVEHLNEKLSSDVGVTTTKRWVRGRLVEVTEGGYC